MKRVRFIFLWYRKVYSIFLTTENRRRLSLKTIFLLCFLAMVLFVMPITFSYSQEKEAISLESLIDEALKNNPQILSAKKRYEAAGARISQASSFEDPMLELGYDKMIPRMTGMKPPMRTYGISQELPFPTKLFLKRKIARKEAAMAFQDYKEQEKTVIRELKSKYAELFLMYRSIAINKENKALLEQFASSAARRFSLGQATQQDALKAQVELAKINNELIILEQKRQIAQAEVNILLNRDPRQELGEPTIKERNKITFSLDELYAITKESRPELLSFRYAVERGKSAYALAKQEYLPDFMVKYERQTVKGEAGPWKGMLGLTFPLWFWEKQNHSVKEMRAELEMVEAEYKTMENMILFEVKDAFVRVESTGKLIEAYETSFLPQVEQTLKASLIGYEANKIDFLNLLDSQRMLLEIKLDYYGALVDLSIAYADLEKSVGKDIFNEHATYGAK